MTSKRSDRRERSRSRLTRQVLVVVAVTGTVALVIGVLLAMGASRKTPENVNLASADTTTAPSLQASATIETTTEAIPAVEVPNVVGMTIAEAKVLLQAAGLSIDIREDSALKKAGVADERKIARQDPVAKELAQVGTGVTLTVPVEIAAADESLAQFVVCIDPGHQAKSDSSQEPIGPGATQTKERVSAGTTGVETGVPEYEVNLQISMNLKARLEAAGVKVVMTRTVNDVNISNSERAAVANKTKADLFVRVHGDGSPDPSTTGVTILYPSPNGWTKAFSADSKRAAEAVHDSVIASTGASSAGLQAREDLSGFNWSKVPVILVECGFMTNPVEDKLLVSPHYQDKLAQGMTDGILDYLREP